MKNLKIDFESLIKGKTDNVYVQFFRYFFVGGFAFVVDFGLLYIFYHVLGIHYLVSATLSFIAGLAVNYAISRIWVFSKSQYSETKAFLLFVFIGVLGLGLNDLIIYMCTGIFGLWVMISKVISTAIVFVFNFAARKIFVF